MLLLTLPQPNIYFFFLGIQARNKILFPLIQLGKRFLHFKHLGISIFMWVKPVYLETLPYFQRTTPKHCYGSANFPSELYGKGLFMCIFLLSLFHYTPVIHSTFLLLCLANWEVTKKQCLQPDKVSLLSRGASLFQWFLEYAVCQCTHLTVVPHPCVRSSTLPKPSFKFTQELAHDLKFPSTSLYIY